ncbi:MAG: twin-arginine translocation signal domain-containing protein [Calditrichaeota bacterium]|nr:MAG: twin-arginine translocation signal domain-containing protein [Calditrichota bacterium]
MSGTRRQFLKTAALTTVGAALSNSGLRCNATQQQPNILWITSEDNSPMFGCYGDQFATTPIFDALARESIVYDHAYATTPVCAPARNCLITGVYPASMGTEHMRSRYPIPDFIKPYPLYLRQAGYYCTNNSKTDYNFLGDDTSYWDECSSTAHYKNRAPDQPFFAIFNLTVSHESSLHTSIPTENLRHDPAGVTLPPYHPDTADIRHDWAQYYDKIDDLDGQVGKILQELQENGLDQETIVFYYADHGGILPRSKRYLYDSGLHVPLIIRFPKKYHRLAPGKAGTRSDRIVTFVDFPKTLLSLAGIQPPDYMQGHAFLGKFKEKPRRYAQAFRSRMDERYDFSRSIRDKRYRYSRNFNPHRIYGQHLTYLWLMPATRSWEAEYQSGRCNDIQSAFWRNKPAEELYDSLDDPWEVNNLAADPNYGDVLLRMRSDLRAWMLQKRDAGFLPEGTFEELSKSGTVYEYVHSSQYHLERIMRTAEMATDFQIDHLPELQQRLTDEDPAVRYWAATGCLVLGESASAAIDQLRLLTDDADGDVAAVAAEALVRLGEVQEGLSTLISLLDHVNGKVRLRAMNALYDLGATAESAIERINHKKQDPDEFVRRMSGYFVH